METFLLLIVLLLLTFQVYGKFTDPAIVNLHNEADGNVYETHPDQANGVEGTDGPDVALYAVAGAAGVFVVLQLLCLGIYYIYQKRKKNKKDSVVQMENCKESPGKQARNIEKRTSYKLVREREANGRFTSKKSKLKAKVKGVRKSKKSTKTSERTQLLDVKLASHRNRVLDVSNNRDDQAMMNKYNKVGVHMYKDPIADTKKKEEKEKARELSKSRATFDAKYKTLKAIGEGTFGIVKLAQRRSDLKQVILKFIRKSKISSWTFDNKYGRIPLEAGVLSKLQHPNIVKVIDVFIEGKFVTMVMEKHGRGMDLFEFVNRKTRLDEPLASFIFRQAVEAVSYLHSLHVVHRDIKEQNMIIDELFHIKLIDFGAAAYFGNGQKFKAFCGTIQYASPEVVLGNKYDGPEQDVWALGVTLNGLIFGTLPFCDNKDIINCNWNEPFPVTRSLSHLLTLLLKPDVKRRAKISELQNNNWVKQYVDIRNYR